MIAVPAQQSGLEPGPTGANRSGFGDALLGRLGAWLRKAQQVTRMARFQISFTTGTSVHPPKEIEGSYAHAKKFAKAQLALYPPGTRYHMRVWREDPVLPVWAPCDDQDFKEC
jgi:hypothetical protein